MCGIAGIAARDGFDPALLMDMTNLVKYRGPDGYGFVFFDVHSNSNGEAFQNREACPTLGNPSLGLGARRLAILDLSESGNQPMQADNGELWITYNGEIYNYPEIRGELHALGHKFRTHTDTEVILKAYQQWGVNCVARFNGMWAFAIWDRRERRLFCSRDRFGVKPFYYFVDESHLIFGSEIKQVLRHPRVPRWADENMVLQYLDQGIKDHSENTFFAHVRQLPPAHSMTVDLKRAPLTIQLSKYWDLRIEPAGNMSEGEAVERFLGHLRRAVNWRLRSDVPVGSCLSGGLDSSSVVMLANSDKGPHEFHAFSSCFDDAAIDERPFIREVVSSAGVISHYVFPRAEEFWDDLMQLIWHQDEPVGNAGVYAQWCVMREARQQRIPVLLDGQGGDEALCGYRKFYLFQLWHLLQQGNPRVVPEALAWLRNVDGMFWNWKYTKRYVLSFGARDGALHGKVCTPEFANNHHHLKNNLGAGENLNQRQKDDLTLWSIPALLHYEDRNSMAHSIEARVPMLDYELVQFAVNCPPNLKLRDGWTKWILRQALRGILPEPVRLRRSKLGFATPQKQWLQHDVRGMVRSLIQNSEFTLRRILSSSKVRQQLDSFVSGRAGSIDDLEAFRIVNLELWARAFEVT